MKKLLLAGAAVLTLGAGAYSVYADGEDTIVERYEYTEDFRPGARGYAYEETRDMTEEERDAWFTDRHHGRREYLEERIQQDLDAGRITEKEAEQWREEIAKDERYDEKNGRSRHGHHNRNNRGGYGHHGSSRRLNRNNRRTRGYCH